ncbi:MAG: sigma-70 family RNA polymerase sigma factor [Methylococcales bacterium]|nr:sigma-70 family RNA polymerase sigma factor [Methylococcales bacterium]
MHKMSDPDQWIPLYGDILYRYSIGRVRYPDVAEDLVQETLLAALKARENYAGQASEQTWLIGILKHKIIDYFRKVSRDKTQELEDHLIADEDDYFNQQGGWKIDFSQWSQPDKSMEQEQFIKTLQACIDKLPPRMAQLFMLRELDDVKNEEICELMSISTQNNLWVMLSRMRVQLRHCLDINWISQ